jgi:hypothetical protein
MEAQCNQNIRLPSSQLRNITRHGWRRVASNGVFSNYGSTGGVEDAVAFLSFLDFLSLFFFSPIQVNPYVGYHKIQRIYSFISSKFVHFEK